MADSGTRSWFAASRWNGTDVTLAWGRRDTCSRIASAVLSCSTRCHKPLYLRSGSSTDTSVSPSASSRTTHSTAARVSRRSGQSTSSSGTRCRPVRAHSSASSAAFASSMTKCTVRISSGVSERAYWMARAEAMSSRSTNTSTTWRRRMGAVAAAGTSCSSWTASRSYCRLRRSSTITRIGMITSITHASSNRVMSTISTTPAESIAPTPFTRTPRCQPCSRSRRWCIVMPDCDSVKPTNTPIA